MNLLGLFGIGRLGDNEAIANFRSNISRAIEFARSGHSAQARSVLNLARSQSKLLKDPEFANTIIESADAVIEQIGQQKVLELTRQLKTDIQNINEALYPDSPAGINLTRAVTSMQSAVRSFNSLPKSISKNFEHLVYDLNERVVEAMRTQTIKDVAETASVIGRWKNLDEARTEGLRSKIIKRLSQNVYRGSIDPLLTRIERDLSMADRISKIKDEDVAAAKTVMEHRDFKNWQGRSKPLIRTAKFLTKYQNTLDRIITADNLIRKSQDLFQIAVKRIPVWDPNPTGYSKTEKAEALWERQADFEGTKNRLNNIAKKILNLTMRSKVLSQTIQLDPETIERRKEEIRKRLSQRLVPMEITKLPSRLVLAPSAQTVLTTPEEVQEAIQHGASMPVLPPQPELPFDYYTNKIDMDLNEAESLLPVDDVRAANIIRRAGNLLQTVIQKAPLWQFQIEPGQSREDADVKYGMFQRSIGRIANRIRDLSMKSKSIREAPETRQSLLRMIMGQPNVP